MANLKMRSEVIAHLTKEMIPFWKSLRDYENGGYIGYLGFDLKTDKKGFSCPNKHFLKNQIHALLHPGDCLLLKVYMQPAR